jgi:ubiquinone/menaquinone biosynthesis C-methylase UbiE
MTLAFAKAYELVATRLTAPISLKALDAVGRVDRNTRLLDIGAGAGALSIPATHIGAQVTAVDIAPGMIELLRERLYAFPSASVELMNGEKLDFYDGAFDTAISVFGISLFQKWKARIG